MELCCETVLPPCGRPSRPSRRIPWERLHCERNVAKAVEGVEHVQECVYEDVGLKQDVLCRLDAVVTDPSVVIASSTSYIPLAQLTAKCHNRQTRKRILIAHPSIPHWGSFMEVCGRKDAGEHVDKARAWFTNIGFDCITLQKSIFGHVWNSFLTLNLQHGERLVQRGVCSAQDVNTVLRHLGRELYARHLFVSVLTTIGGDQGVDGGLVLRHRVGKGALAIALETPVRWLPGSRVWGRVLAKLLKPLVLPAPDPAWLEACREFEDSITKGGAIPVQDGMFRSSELTRTYHWRLVMTRSRFERHKLMEMSIIYTMPMTGIENSYDEMDCLVVVVDLWFC